MKINNYFITAEFKNSNNENNIALKKSLNDAKFKSSVISNNNIVYKLTNAMYRFDSEFEIEDVLDKVKKIAFKIDSNEENIIITVTKSEGSFWFNLDVITE